MRRTSSRLRFLSVVREELAKVIPLMHYNAKNTTQSVASYVEVLKGTDASTPEALAKEQERKKAYEAILARKRGLEAEQRAAKTAKMTMQQRMKFAWEEMKTATSKKSGVVALVQHCAAAHAAEVAVDLGIDVKSVNVCLEHANAPQGVTSSSRVVGYIDAPAASEEEVMAFATKLERACPAARAMHGRIDWRKLPYEGHPDSISGDTSSNLNMGRREGGGGDVDADEDGLEERRRTAGGYYPAQRSSMGGASDRAADQQTPSTSTSAVMGEGEVAGGPHTLNKEDAMAKKKKKYYWQL